VIAQKEIDMRLNRYFAAAACLAAMTLPVAAKNANDRITEANTVLHELLGAGDKGIPSDLLDRAHCAVIIPGAKKGGFFVGAEYGRGFILCRGANHHGWGAPAAVKMEGGNFGAQIGVAETDIFMLVMNDTGMRHLLEDKFTLGADAGVAAGPVGRDSSARTDAQMQAGILSWSRSRGAFAGITLNGATLRPDKSENEELYGRALTNREILTGSVHAPASASALVATLNEHSHAEHGEASRSK
jgi:lipid-binding SYLF domain-containing protein